MTTLVTRRRLDVSGAPGTHGDVNAMSYSVHREWLMFTDVARSERAPAVMLGRLLL